MIQTIKLTINKFNNYERCVNADESLVTKLNSSCALCYIQSKCMCVLLDI